jgi:hypothetical protein
VVLTEVGEGEGGSQVHIPPICILQGGDQRFDRASPILPNAAPRVLNIIVCV